MRRFQLLSILVSLHCRKPIKNLADIVLCLPSFVPIERSGTPVLAVSGGRDSMLLLYIFHNLYQQGAAPKPIVFHLQHGLRQEAEEDLELVREVCQKLDIHFYYAKKNILKFSRRFKRSIEESGRLLRYRCLSRLVKKHTPAYGVTAHHADDYLESLLVHLIRGGGPSSLTTLPIWKNFESIAVMRPLLSLSRMKITELTQTYQVPFHDDISNQSTQFLRNRIRKNVTPILQKEGLDSIKLWENFHNQHSCSDSEKEGTHPVKYLYLDRRFFEQKETLKPLWDICFQRLGLGPAKRSFLDELQKQLEKQKEQLPFRLSYHCKAFYVWSDRRGPVWLFHTRAPVFRPFRIKYLGRDGNGALSLESNKAEIIEIDYNHKQCRIQLGIDEEIVSFQKGMRFLRKKGSIKTKKIFQEFGLPPPIRKNLPLLRNRRTGYITKIFFMFWESR